MLKGNSRDVRVSSIMVRIDKSHLNGKECQVNAPLTEMCEEKKVNLINHLKRLNQIT